MKRLIFIPGLGEEAFIFDKIHPRLPGEKVIVDNWALIDGDSRPALTARVYARELADRYAITSQDVVIGHSMGGWIALHLKQLTGCRIVQIASWTDQRKVNRPVENLKLIYWLVEWGLYFNRWVLRRMIRKYYRNKPSEAIFSTVFRRLMQGSREGAANQLRLIFNPVAEPLQVAPDLRIHARGDHLVRFPDEAFLEVPGDHFTLYTQPEAVYGPVAAFLAQPAEVAHS
jgi:pimeloyl-ACP methyl ester carboxylesterase